MRYLLCIPIVFMMNFVSINAQTHSDFEIVKSEQPGEVIYKGSCTLMDIGQVEAFHLNDPAKFYKTNKKVIDELEPKLSRYEIILFLGTWCEDSHILVPQLCQVLKETNFPDKQLLVYALDREKKGKNKEEEKYRITQVPTIILIENGQEKGRITEIVKNSAEEDLLEIVEQK